MAEESAKEGQVRVMGVKASNVLGSTSLELGTDLDALGSTAKRCWFVTAKTAPAGGKGHLKQWGPLYEAEARQVYDHLVETFTAIVKANQAFHDLVGETPQSFTHGGVEIFVSPELENIGRYGSGVDYGADRMLLAQCGTKKLWWRKGHTAWVCQGQTGYYKAELCCGKGYASDISRTIFEGGRLTKKRLMEHAAKIDEYFGFEITQHLDPKRTMRFTLPEAS